MLQCGCVADENKIGSIKVWKCFLKKTIKIKVHPVQITVPQLYLFSQNLQLVCHFIKGIS